MGKADILLVLEGMHLIHLGDGTSLPSLLEGYKWFPSPSAAEQRYNDRPSTL